MYALEDIRCRNWMDNNRFSLLVNVAVLCVLSTLLKYQLATHYFNRAYEFQALQDTHYQHVNVTPDVDKWTYM